MRVMAKSSCWVVLEMDGVGFGSVREARVGELSLVWVRKGYHSCFRTAKNHRCCFTSEVTEARVGGVFGDFTILLDYAI